MSENRVYRPRICEICHRRIEHAATGRPRLTCGDRCRQIKRRRYDYAGWKDKRRAEQAERKAEKQICKWEKQTKLDFKTVAGYHFDPYAMCLYDRLMLYLRRGWPVQTCWTCGRPYMPDGRRSPTCSKKCHRERRAYFKAVTHSFAIKGRVPERAMHPYLRDEKRLGICTHCGDPYVPTRRDRKFCTDKCRKAAWERARSPLRNWPVGSKPVKKFCAMCGNTFIPATPKHQVPQEFCTRKCYNRLKRRVWQAKQVASRPPSYCLRCEMQLPKGTRKKLCTDCTRLNRLEVARNAVRRWRERQRGLALGIPVQLPSGVRVPVRERELVMVAGD